MKSLRFLKKRIKSIKNTEKITNALEMVSISKMKKFQTFAIQSKEYAMEVERLASLISGLYKRDEDLLSEPIAKNYFESRSDDSPICLIVIGPTRGFCGSLINDMLIKLNKELDKSKHYMGIGLQKKSWYLMSKFSNIKIELLFEKAVESPTFNSIEAPFEYILKNYFAGKYAKILLYYMEFISSFNYKPTLKQLLPLNYDNFLSKSAQVQKSGGNLNNYLIEPNINVVFKQVANRYLQTMFLYSFISSKASEHNARMIAMKNATDNAKQLRNILNLQYNKSRQESITTELLDIIGGTMNK